MTEPDDNALALRVLLVEDNPSHAELVEQLLSIAPRRIVCVWRDSLADAVREAEKETHHAVLLDLILPDSPAPDETLARMLEAARGAPTVVLTSVQDSALGREAVHRGAQDYLVKGNLSAELLIRTIEYAIERKRYAARIERSNRDLQHFAYVVAHELRSPLSIMIASLDLLLSKHGAEVPAAVNEWIENCRQSAEELSALLTELLSFSTVAGEFDVEPVNCQDLLESVLRGMQTELASSGAVVSLEPLPTVLAPRAALGHIFQNLISNAIKYRRAETPRVRVHSERGPNEWIFHVQDNGRGINSEDLARVFQMFARSDRPRGSAVGFGIGLAFCKQAVERLGGRIWVESRLGEGSTFSFSMPVMTGAEGSDLAAVAATPSLTTTPPVAASPSLAGRASAGHRQSSSPPA